MPPPGPVESAQGVDSVFHGKLLSVVVAPKPDQYGITNKIYTFEVVRTFKGQLDPEVNLYTADNDAACGRAFEPIGSEWLLYARRDDAGQLYDNLCSRTMPIAHAAGDIAELEQNADALDDEPPRPEPPGKPGPADPEPEPIEPENPDMGQDTSDEQPEPTPKPSRCTVIDDTPANGLGGLLALGFALLWRRRSKARPN